MVKATLPKPKPAHDWYLAQWLKACGKEQVDLEKELEWNKSKGSLLLNGKQRYHRDDVNEVSAWLGIQPYELLMHPQDAMAIRQLRIEARKLAGDGPPFQLITNDQDRPLDKVAEKPAAFAGPNDPRPAGAPAPRRGRRVAG